MNTQQSQSLAPPFTYDIDTQKVRKAVARIVFITGTPATVREGSGTYVGISALRKALIAIGLEVELIAPPLHLRSAFVRLWFNYRARTLMQALRPDAIVGFDLDGVFLSPRNVLDVACIKGVVAEELRFEKGIERVSLLIQSYFERQRVQHAGRVLTTSHYAALTLENCYGLSAGEVRIVPELIDLAHWQAALGRAHRERRPEASILCVAHLYVRKDLGTLLRAMKCLQTTALLRIAGIGPELARLQQLSQEVGVEDRVRFLEHISFAQLAQEYRNADVFCLPSRQEGFGIVLLEAMAAGLPIVAARAGAIPEVLQEGRCGVLIKPGDAAGFAAALDTLLQEPAARHHLSQAGLQRAARYDAPGVAREFLTAIGFG